MENVSQNAYKEEAKRLQTFASWPKRDVVSPEVLASDGFFYFGTGDMVECIFCKGRLRAWEPGCVPREDHERYFPQCPYVGGYDVGNVPLGQDNRRNPLLGKYNSSSSTSGESSSAPAADAAIATTRLKAVTPQMAPRSARQSTFTTWALHDTHRTLVLELTDGGFYFSGVGDQMKCFCCDGCLEQWTQDDNVWSEHARHFPQCEYLLLAKGAEFVADVQSTVAKRGASAQTSGPKPVKLYPVDPREVRARLDTPRVRNMLAVGYTVAELTMAIEQQLRTKGSDFATLSEFITALEDVRKKNNAPALSSTGLPQSAPSTGATSSAAAAGATRDTARAAASAGGTSVGAAAAVPADRAKAKTAKKTRSMKGSTEEQAVESEVRTAMDEYRQLREARQCKVCLDEDIAVVFLPCGHACTCIGCAATVTHCPICRHFIRGTVKIAL